MDLFISFDYHFLVWLSEHIVSEPLTILMRIITSLGNAGLVWLIAAFIFMKSPKTRSCGISMVVALLLTVILNSFFLKPFVARPRPFIRHPDLIPLISPPVDFSFPSGHSGSSFAAAYSCFRHQKTVGICLLILASLIAFSRLYLCVHYPSDVLCGSVLGIICGYAADKLVSYFIDHPRKTAI